MKFHSPRQPFSSRGSSHVKNSENREWSSPVHTQRPDRNRGCQTPSATARRRDVWEAPDFGFTGRDARQPGCSQVSQPLRGRWHRARPLSPPCPTVDQSTKTLTQATTGRKWRRFDLGQQRLFWKVVPMGFNQYSSTERTMAQTFRKVGLRLYSGRRHRPAPVSILSSDASSAVATGEQRVE